MMYEGDNKKSIRAAGVSKLLFHFISNPKDGCQERRLLIFCLLILTELQL